MDMLSSLRRVDRLFHELANALSPKAFLIVSNDLGMMIWSDGADLNKLDLSDETRTNIHAMLYTINTSPIVKRFEHQHAQFRANVVRWAYELPDS